ncbi:MAG: phosphotransacetylase family protein [Peptococcaceae bacterium]|nr:phosphotransacetylase family protein [Peptococcaceae bacterium]
MKSLYLIGTPGSGKTAIALGLALKFRKEGLNAGYFKPVGSTPGVAAAHDEDGILMKEVLKLDESLDTLVPLTASLFYVSAFKDPKYCQEKVLNAYQAIAAKYDPVIIDGSSFPWVMAGFGLDAPSIARLTQSAVLCTIKVDNDFTFDEAVFINNYASMMGVPMVGTVFNNVPRPLLAKTEGPYASLLASFGYRWMGTIPRRREIHAPTVAEFFEVLGGEILTGEDRLDLLVEDVLIGAMTIESAIDNLRRSLNKAVITGGDRADYALAALETSTSVLILTGGLYPNVNVVARASEKGVPVILVHYDTYTTIEKLSAVTRRIRPGDDRAIGMALENIERYCNWHEILESLKV